MSAHRIASENLSRVNCAFCGGKLYSGHKLDCPTRTLPWAEKTAPDRVRPRECVGNARDALNRCYAIEERAAVPLLIEALDWLRRALEQMAAASLDSQESPK